MLRLQRWQAEEERKGKKALDEMLDLSKERLKSHKRRTSVGDGLNDDSQGEGSGTSEDSSSSDEPNSEDEANMSSNESDAEDEPIVVDDDENLTPEQLRQKYGSIRPTEKEEIEDAMQIDQEDLIHAGSSLGAEIALDQVDDALMDASDESTDMDNDMGSSGKGSSEDEEDGSENSGEDEGLGLLGGFLSKKERKEIAETTEGDGENFGLGLIDETAMTFDDSEDEADKVSLIPDATQGPTPTASEEPPAKASPELIEETGPRRTPTPCPCS